MSKRNRNAKSAPVSPVVEQAEHALAVELAAPVEQAAPVAAPVAAPKVKTARYVSGRFAPAQVVRLISTTNHKRGKSHARFGLHFGLGDQYTVAQYVQASVDAGNKAALAHDDLRWDAAHGFITVEAPAPKAE
jgi:hypothetical protein